MSRKDTEFWNQLKRLAMADDHVEVPAATISSALAIFQPREKESRVNIFSLRPAFTGFVRKASSSGEKLLFELGDDLIVQLDKTRDERGYHLSGVAHGFDQIPVVLYGDECAFETTIDSGSFEFHSLATGKYNLSFSLDGEAYWIRDLELVEKA